MKHYVMTPARRLRIRRQRLLLGLTLAAALAIFGMGTGGAGASPTSYKFSGSGWGHAVGMSQWGARGMAASGKSSAEILKHYYTGVTVGSEHAVSENVRVLLSSGQSSVEFTPSVSTRFGALGTAGVGAKVTATRSGNSIVLRGGVVGTSSGPVDVPLNPSSAGMKVSTTGDSYRLGTLRLSIDPAGGLRVTVRDLTMQQYLYGLGEMPSSWPTAALQAQVTASRTYAQKQIETRKGIAKYADFDLYATTVDQAYRGTKYEAERTHSNWVSAVDSTTGQVVLYANKLIDAVYSASSGGYTENSEFVWVSTVSYLRAVADPADLTGGNPNASWARSYTAVELGSWFGVGSLTSVQFLDAPRPSGHLDKSRIRLTGTKGTVEVTGASLRSTINSKAGSGRDLRSTKFTVSGSASSADTPPDTPPTTKPPAPKPPTGGTMAKGSVTVASADGRTVRVAGTAVDPDGAPLVRVVSTMGSERAVRDRRAVNGRFDVSWSGSPGTRNVCVTIYDAPTGRGASLGCRDIIVK
ncbi:MAG TPA: SpoIID/LytB domain-containing protein [Microthrixaceae bacterium]|nr:SpoIID/LytB domain-containing protein [Microthrixaceae bacterium]